MNATETIFALALASNNNPKQHFLYASEQLAKIGQLQFSNIYLIPCRDGVGADYWNAACLLKSSLSVADISVLLKNMEASIWACPPITSDFTGCRFDCMGVKT